MLCGHFFLALLTGKTSQRHVSIGVHVYEWILRHPAKQGWGPGVLYN